MYRNVRVSLGTAFSFVTGRVAVTNFLLQLITKMENTKLLVVMARLLFFFNVFAIYGLVVIFQLLSLLYRYCIVAHILILQ